MSIFRRNHAPAHGSTPPTYTETLSGRLARATTPEERDAIWDEHVRSKEFSDDCQRVGKLILEGDEAGVVAFGLETVHERAAARAFEIRQPENPEA